MNTLGKKIVEIVVKTTLVILVGWLLAEFGLTELWVIEAENSANTAFAYWWIIGAVGGFEYVLGFVFLFGLILLIELLWWAITRLISLFSPTWGN